MTDIRLLPYAASWIDELVPMWREAFEFGVGVADPHPIEEQRDYFESVVLPGHQVTLAVEPGGSLVGFIAASRESVAQLHVRVGWHRRGVGSMLLDHAKACSAGSLWLYTFASNRVAQAFYEHHGFVVVERGFEPSWQLEDIRYLWVAPPAAR